MNYFPRLRNEMKQKGIKLVMWETAIDSPKKATVINKPAGNKGESSEEQREATRSHVKRVRID